MAEPRIGRAVGLLIALVFIIMWGSLLIDALWLDGHPIAFIYVGAFFAIGLVCFFGGLYVARYVRSPAGVFQDGDVRFAIALAFVTVFFAMLAFFVFSPYRLDPPPFVEQWTDNMLTITALVVGFYFATSGALEFVKARQPKDQNPAGGPPQESEPADPQPVRYGRKPAGRRRRRGRGWRGLLP
jgi:hypothetical protein